LEKLIKDPKKFANLLLSVGKQGQGSSRKQPLSPIDTAKYLKRFMEEENLSGAQASERLGLGRARDTTKSLFEDTDKTQVDFFLKLLELSPSSREFCAWGWEKGVNRINMTTLFRLNKLKHEEQDQIIQSIRRQKKEYYESDGETPRPLKSGEALKISQDRRKNPEVPIQEYIDKVLKIRPVIEIHNFVVCIMDEKLKKYVDTHDDYAIKLNEILKNNMDATFYDVDAENGHTITIEMDEKGLKIFDDQEKNNDLTYSQFLNKFMEEKID